MKIVVRAEKYLLEKVGLKFFYFPCHSLLSMKNKLFNFHEVKLNACIQAKYFKRV
jgi:hypothetical protein